MMRSVYVTNWQDKEPVGMRTPVEVFFSFDPEVAHTWPTKQQALCLCPIFDSLNVKTPWAEGEYTCKGFGVEERAPGQYVIFCDGPFLFTNAA